MQAARVLKGKTCGNGEFALSVYPSSQPVFLEMASNGAAFDLTITAGLAPVSYTHLDVYKRQAYPRVVAVYLEGAPAPGVGPQDIALAIVRAVFD